MSVTAKEIYRLSSRAKPEIADGIEAHSGLIARYGIDTPLRIAHFMAQLAHESDGFQTAREYHDGSNYEDRADLGNTHPGDGRRYRGRGLIQLTGRDNYRRAGDALGRNLVGHPEMVEQFPIALEVSCWFWSSNNINRHADLDHLNAVTRKINGGHNGLNDRKRYLAISKGIWVEGMNPRPPARQRGDQGAWVESIQRTLSITPQDGWFGPQTEEAVKAWQQKKGLTVDGIVGPKTWASFDKKGAGEKPEDRPEPQQEKTWRRYLIDAIMAIAKRIFG